MKIIFENQDLIAVDKPALWLSVPSRMGEKDQRTVVGIELQKQKGRIFPVHRLDEEVSGLLLFARSEKAQKISQAWFEQKQIHKTYQAYASKNWDSEFPEQFLPQKPLFPGDLEEGREFHWKSRIQRGKRRSFESPHGDEAITDAKYLGESEKGMKWLLHPKTGRSHQLRFEMFKRGFPIIGDKLYGSGEEWHEPGIALRAMSLDLSEIENRLGLPTLLQLEDGYF